MSTTDPTIYKEGIWSYRLATPSESTCTCIRHIQAPRKNQIDYDITYCGKPAVAAMWRKGVKTLFQCEDCYNNTLNRRKRLTLKEMRDLHIEAHGKLP